MQSLFKLQEQFYQAILLKQPELLASVVKENQLAIENKVSIYHNTVIFTLTHALQDTYRVTCKLVGDDYFRQLAKAYIKQYTSISGDLNLYGEYLDDFLKTLSDVSFIPYLPEVAQLEWLMLKAFYAKDQVPFDINKLSQVAVEHYPYLKFILHPAAQLTTSVYPVVSIWQAHQQTTIKPIDLTPAQYYILVYRLEDKVYLMNLEEEEYAFLSALAEQAPFARAVEAALAVSDSFAPDVVLQRFVSYQVIADVLV